MRSIFRIAVLLLAFNAAARAENGVLVERVPGGAESERVIEIVKQSLLFRHWKIERVDATSVSATIDHLDYDAKIRIALTNGQILYDASAIRTVRAGPSAPPSKRSDNVPKRWIGLLRQDISAVVMAMPEQPQ